VTATGTSSSRRSAGARRAAAALAALAVLAPGWAAVACAAPAPPAARSHGQALGLLAPRTAPPDWRRASLPGGAGVLAYPPVMHMITGDAGTVSAAQLTSSGGFLGYLNVTPRQGPESLRDWPGFRLRHLLGDDASSARSLGAARGVRFLGGTGSCVMDDYVTRVRARQYTEIACFVQGRHGSSVIVAAAPAQDWAAAAPLLRQALAGYLAR
jgi:hypothetical protein